MPEDQTSGDHCHNPCKVQCRPYVNLYIGLATMLLQFWIHWHLALRCIVITLQTPIPTPSPTCICVGWHTLFSPLSMIFYTSVQYAIHTFNTDYFTTQTLNTQKLSLFKFETTNPQTPNIKSINSMHVPKATTVWIYISLPTYNNIVKYSGHESL